MVKIKDRKHLPKENQVKLKILLNEVYGNYHIKVSYNDVRSIIIEMVKDYDENNKEFNNFNKLLNLYKNNGYEKISYSLNQKIKGSNGGSGIFESLTSDIRKKEINNNYIYDSELSD